MKKNISLYLFIIVLTMNACTSQTTASPTHLPVTEPTVFVETQTLIDALPTAVDQSTDRKPYTNSIFGLSFQYPSSWFGPDEYVSDQNLRVEVGSDKVYPYGTDRMEQIHEIKNSYYVLTQYSKNDQNQSWKDTYQSLLNLQDGESLSGARSLIIRVRQLKVGRFDGIEYISTLSETVQIEPAYGRQVILFDEQSNVLTIMGTPVNVEISDGMEWRDAYRIIDETNLPLFHEIVESITIE